MILLKFLSILVHVKWGFPLGVATLSLSLSHKFVQEELNYSFGLNLKDFFWKSDFYFSFRIFNLLALGYCTISDIIFFLFPFFSIWLASYFLRSIEDLNESFLFSF